MSPIFIIHGRSTDIITTNIDDAKRSAWYQSESDEGWFDCLEVVESDGSSVKLEAADIPEFEIWNDEQYRRYQTQREAEPHVANLRLDGSDVIESFYGADGLASAYRKLAELTPYLNDRVAIVLTDAGKQIESMASRGVRP